MTGSIQPLGYVVMAECPAIATLCKAILFCASMLRSSRVVSSLCVIPSYPLALGAFPARKYPRNVPD